MAVHYDEFHRSYAKTKKQKKVVAEGDFTYINFFRYILPVIKETDPGRILDIGSGAGTISMYLGNLGYRVVGIDVSSVAVSVSKQSVRDLFIDDRVELVHTDLVSYTTKDKFDLILCLEVIEHTDDDEGLLSRAGDLLNPEGLLIVSTPLKTAPLTRLGMTSGFDSSVGHLRRYGRNQIVSKIIHAGYTVDHCVETEGIVRNALFIFPWLNSLVRLIRRGFAARMITAIDDALGKLLGYSDVIIFARKKQGEHV
jgi:SAM-dependent methyltransferase